MSSRALCHPISCIILTHVTRFLSPAAGPEQRCGPSRRRCHRPRPQQTAEGWPSTLWSKNNHQSSQYFRRTHFQSNVGTDWAEMGRFHPPFFGHDIVQCFQTAPGPLWSACRGWRSRWARAGPSSPCSWTCCCPAACGRTQRYWTPDSQSLAPHLQGKEERRNCRDLLTG